MSLMVSVVFSTGITFAELANMPETKKIWDTYVNQHHNSAPSYSKWYPHIWI